jgi:hypothetical protein
MVKNCQTLPKAAEGVQQMTGKIGLKSSSSRVSEAAAGLPPGIDQRKHSRWRRSMPARGAGREAFNVGFDPAPDDPELLAGKPFRSLNAWPKLVEEPVAWTATGTPSYRSPNWRPEGEGKQEGPPPDDARYAIRTRDTTRMTRSGDGR